MSLEQLRQVAGRKPQQPRVVDRRPDLAERGTIPSGGYGQGSNADPAVQQRIEDASTRLDIRERRLGPAGSEERVEEAQAGIDAFSYMPREAENIRRERRDQARQDPAGRAAARKAARDTLTAERRAIVAARRGGSAVISARRDEPRPPAAAAPLTLEEQTEQRLRERLIFDQYKFEADREFKVRTERIRIQETAMRMAKAGVQMTPEIRGKIAKLEARRTRLESEYKLSGNEIGRLRDELSDAMTPGGDFDQDDIDDITPMLLAAERRAQDILKRLGEVVTSSGELEAEEVQKAQEFLKTGDPGLEKAAKATGAYGAGGQAAPQEEAPAVVYSPVLNKSVTVEMIEAYAKAKNIPVQEVYQRLGTAPP